MSDDEYLNIPRQMLKILFIKIFGENKNYILLCIPKYFYNMETNSKSIEDIKTIRKIMEESSRFLSLSGLSGVFAGAFAITGAFVAYFFILRNGNINYDEYLMSLSEKESLLLRWQLLADAAFVLFLSVLFAFYFSLRKSKRDRKNFWTPVSKRLLLNLIIPLITGGIFTIVLLIQNNLSLIIPVFLIFYGLALVNAGKFTYGEIFYLGLLEIITGLLAGFFPQLGLIFWVFGFGILHIIYGLAMYRKYEV